MSVTFGDGLGSGLASRACEGFKPWGPGGFGLRLAEVLTEV